ncbi:hypothetical protein PRZ48_009716 [Zasmidium cellare]|uniref:Heterokaryon incompatibility domain-containing protein n=1 Tax=Zasmidium cellare TaxID=395010 RepID=A0ABR0EDD4_ZASCE|nr:hypothetical protein PRZ48_009716 [Zasmidium cellare]
MSSFKTEERPYNKTDADHDKSMSLPSSSTTANEHLYRLLPLEPWQTRLLRLNEAGEGDPMSGDLVVVDITHLDGAVLHDSQKHIDYNALSYAWGVGPFSKSMLLNGVSVELKENLFNFLLQYRKSSRDDFHLDYIWIDAICIDQANDHEKSNQVASMMVFYQRAKQVLVWLGEGDSSTDAAMEFLQHGETNGHGNRRLAPFKADSDVGRGISELCSTPWATRVWVRQEIWSAKEVLVLFGRLSVSWEVLHKFLTNNNAADSDGVYYAEKKYGLSNLGALLGLERRPKAPTRLIDITLLHQEQDVLHLLENARHCESTDVRDRVYALLGMCNDQDIKVDYTLDPAEVFTSLAKHLIKRENRVAVILALNASFGPSSDINLPTWVPDWRRVRANARDTFWKEAFEAKGHREDLDIVDGLHPLLEEWIVPLPAECRNVQSIARRRNYPTFCSETATTLRLRGFILSILPESVGTTAGKGIRIPWNPLSAVPTISPSFADVEDKFSAWQHSVRSRALKILNSTPSLPKRKHALFPRQPKPADTKEWRTLTKALGFYRTGYGDNPVPKHIKAQKATLSDLADLGATDFELRPRNDSELQWKAGDVLVVVHGSEAPVVLRPIEDKDQFTFRENMFEYLRVVLYAREALGLAETFEVV